VRSKRGGGARGRPAPQNLDGGRIHLSPLILRIACSVIAVTSWYLSQHLCRQVCSLLLRLDPGFVTHFSKHLSRTPLKNSWNMAASSCALICCRDERFWKLVSYSLRSRPLSARLKRNCFQIP